MTPDTEPGTIVPTQTLIEDARNGRMVILADHEDRENEGDLIIPAQMTTPDVINFMATHGRGLICLALTEERIAALGLQLMTAVNSSRHETAFTVSIEAKEGITTGISAHDRALTVQTAIDPASGAGDIATPGHIFPLQAQKGGVLVRAGHTEAGIDIVRLAGLNPSAVICEILNADGTMARMPDLLSFSRKHGIHVGTIADLIAYRLQYDQIVRCRLQSHVESAFGGEWDLHIFRDETQDMEHIALTKGVIDDGEPVLVRVHASNVLADLLGFVQGRHDQIRRAMQQIAATGRGVLVLIRETSPTLDPGPHESPHTLREYGLGAQILSSLGVRRMILLSNSPSPRVIALEGHGLTIDGTLPIP
ncbi:MAG: 3,4-dihydroxy-2-butanone-4-phosphate synthase, partial [Rhodobacteraceae bacterium]|nr:3,4-dihydroxy-2-butanone-4-phosphate synthase [Paracoccaceae bacterium]